LIAGDNAKVIEKILIRLSGGSVPSIGDEPNFEIHQQKMFRDSVAYAWVNVSPLVDMAIKSAASGDNRARAQSPLAPRQDKLLQAMV